MIKWQVNCIESLWPSDNIWYCRTLPSLVSDKGLSLVPCQASTWSNADLLLQYIWKGPLHDVDHFVQSSMQNLKYKTCHTFVLFPCVVTTGDDATSANSTSNHCNTGTSILRILETKTGNIIPCLNPYITHVYIYICVCVNNKHSWITKNETTSKGYTTWSTFVLNI